MQTSKGPPWAAGYAMRRFVLFVVLVIAATPAYAAQQAVRMTVAQLSKMLAGCRGEKDSRVARQLSTIELTERVSPANLARWQSEFRGKHTRRALTGLADASAFLDPPASEIPAQPQPTLEEMRQIVTRAVDYVNHALRRLPNFYAVRTTSHFENQPAHQQDLLYLCTSRYLGRDCASPAGERAQAGQPAFSPMHFTGSVTAVVTYRDGEEVVNSHPVNVLSPRHSPGLVSTGEFGPVLSVVLGDSLHGKIVWGHWERGANGPLAVFRFTVPKQSSHYEVDFPSVSSDDKVRPAYHGEFAVDPASGAIMRIALQGDLEPPHQDETSALVVEYGPVSIGGTQYICPVRAVAFSSAPVVVGRMGEEVKLPILQTRLNDILFTRYRLFRAEMKILPDAGGVSPASTAPLTSQAH
jgi:hypothetical protein